ncbi:MAG TPA: BlaI/MecI/CopY family transcriptional regulator [Planctomycetaceae bacterium]|nr:BlaI/MecI/CopY family transcriptional regulator [Planctomycetaceae bacterium]HQZ66089.1 BlaI/MecI/CopY family transcriptional regulator [Planctomycetaceae bacterium]
MAKKKPSDGLARRERQIMDVIHLLSEATVSDVREKLSDPPSYSAVRTMIRHLESKGLLKHRQDGKRYVYRATQSRVAASRSALRKLLDVFFAGSPSDAVAAILDVQGKQVDQAELDRIEALIQNARTEGK